MKGAPPEKQADKLRWQRIEDKIQVNNPAQRVMNFNEISFAGKKVPDVSYVLPDSTAMPDLSPGVMGGPVTSKTINDYGSPGAGHKISLWTGEKMLNGIYDDGNGLYRGTISAVGIVDNHHVLRYHTK